LGQRQDWVKPGGEVVPPSRSFSPPTAAPVFRRALHQRQRVLDPVEALAALIVDGVHFGQSCCVVALGIDISCERSVASSSDNAVSVVLRVRY